MSCSLWAANTSPDTKLLFLLLKSPITHTYLSRGQGQAKLLFLLCTARALTLGIHIPKAVPEWWGTSPVLALLEQTVGCLRVFPDAPFSPKSAGGTCCFQFPRPVWNWGPQKAGGEGFVGRDPTFSWTVIPPLWQPRRHPKKKPESRKANLLLL